jgi:hypothetical protein
VCSVPGASHHTVPIYAQIIVLDDRPADRFCSQKITFKNRIQTFRNERHLDIDIDHGDVMANLKATLLVRVEKPKGCAHRRRYIYIYILLLLAGINHPRGAI